MSGCPFPPTDNAAGRGDLANAAPPRIAPITPSTSAAMDSGSATPGPPAVVDPVAAGAAAPVAEGSIHRTTELSLYVCSTLKVSASTSGKGPSATGNSLNSPGLIWLAGESAVQTISLTASVTWSPSSFVIGFGSLAVITFAV